MPRITAISVDGALNRPGIDATPGRRGAARPRGHRCSRTGRRAARLLRPDDRPWVRGRGHDRRLDPRRPSIISISWGDAEANWTEQARFALDDAFHAAAALGITVCAASGDTGWRDGVSGSLAHVDYPASSPYVLACGGTRLELRNGEVTEVVWNDHDGNSTGGGVSVVLTKDPVWQRTANVPRSVNPRGERGRGVPDVAGNADPETGYLIGDGRSTTPLRWHERGRAFVGGADRTPEPAAGRPSRIPEPAALRRPSTRSFSTMCRRVETARIARVETHGTRVRATAAPEAARWSKLWHADVRVADRRRVARPSKQHDRERPALGLVRP